MNQAVVDYGLNKFIPFGIVGFLLFYNSGYETWEPYVISALILFIDRFSFKTGYSVAYCERNNINLNCE